MTKKEIAKMAAAYGKKTQEQRTEEFEKLKLTAMEIQQIEEQIALDRKIQSSFEEEGMEDLAGDFDESVDSDEQWAPNDPENVNTGADDQENDQEEEEAPAKAKKGKAGKADAVKTLNKRYNVVRMVLEGNQLLEGPILRKNVKLTEDRVARLNNPDKVFSTRTKYVLVK